MTNKEQQHMMLQMHDARVAQMKSRIAMREITIQRYGAWVPQAIQDAENVRQQSLKNAKETLEFAFVNHLKL